MQIVPAGNRKLTLSTRDNGGHLRMAWLGVGSAFGTLNNQCNVFAIKGDASVLIDCGNTASRALADLGLSTLDITAVLPTHSHADHVGGLEEVALKGRYIAPFVKGGRKGDHKPKCLITEEYQSYLWNFSLRGGLAFSEQIWVDGSPTEMRFTDYFEPIRPRPIDGYDRPVYRCEYGGIDLLLMRTKHIPEEPENWAECFWSCGVVLDGRVLHSGDTRFDPPLLRQFVTDDIEAIFHDGQSFRGGVHASVEELAGLPAEVRTRMWLVHLDDNMLRMNEAAADRLDASLKAEADLRLVNGVTAKDLAEAHATVESAKAAAMDAADAVLKEKGFAGLARPATECYYDFS